MSTSSRGKGIARRARWNLLYAQNCAHATLLSLEGIFGKRDPVLMRAATNFEGGCVGCGSTCGVVTGGILGLGGHLASLRPGGGRALEEEIFDLAVTYRRWFEDRYGSSLCRERVGADFESLRGFLRYLIPGDKLVKCFDHIGGSLAWFGEKAPAMPAGDRPARAVEAAGESGGPREPHCAYSVLRAVTAETGAAVNGVGWASVGLAGGVALGGGLCGALAGAVLCLGLRYGYDAGAMGWVGITRAFLVGHRNLLRRERFLEEHGEASPPREAFARSRVLADGFRRRFGSLHCREITGRAFSSLEDLRDFLARPGDCREVMDWCRREAVRLAGP